MLPLHQLGLKKPSLATASETDRRHAGFHTRIECDETWFSVSLHNSDNIRTARVTPVRDEPICRFVQCSIMAEHGWAIMRRTAAVPFDS